MSTDTPTEASNELVTLRREGGVAVLTLNVPHKRNVLSAPLVQAIGARFDEVEKDESVRCVVLTGAGPAFCAGAELSTLRAAADGDFDTVRVVYDGFLRVLRSPLPTIGAINGPAVGAGFNLALACDIRLAGESALFDTRFAKLRLHPGGGHTWLLARAVGQQRAMLANLFGEVWKAERALEAGLVAEVHPDDALLHAAIAKGRLLDEQEPVYVRTLTDTLRRALTIPTHAEALAHETTAQEASAKRPAFKAGVDAIEAQVKKGRK
jgi:enoyl-CoA hydratase